LQKQERKTTVERPSKNDRVPGSTDTYQRSRSKKSSTKKETNKRNTYAVKRNLFARDAPSVMIFSYADNDEEPSAAETTENLDNPDSQTHQEGSGLLSL
jgi:hypothetical protein